MPHAELQMACTPGIGATLGSRLIQHFGTAERALAAGERAWRELGVPRAACAALAASDNARLDETERWLEAPNHHFITRDHRHYSSALAELDPAPPWLYGLGDTELLNYPAIAIVGSRNPSHAGRAAAHEFGQALAAVDGVQAIHDLHIWSLSSSQRALAAHVEIARLSDWQRILPSLQALLAERFSGSAPPVLVSW